jgi:hypothetical protein
MGVLGSGGFASVYRTWQEAVGRETAVKVDSRALHSERDRRRFFREVTAAGRLSGHPHIIDVYDAGTLNDGRPYMVMELCPGGSLNDELQRNGPLVPASACQIGINLADALAAAHELGILHRDLKPANILINRYGVVGIADFGLASIIAAGGEQSVSRDALTPAYAPPESFRGDEPSAAADIYSMAATLYALLAGRPPHFPASGESPGMWAILERHGQPVEDIPGVPARLMDILQACLAADPAQRLPSAASLRDELAALLGPDRGRVPSREWPVPGAPSPALAMSSSLAPSPGRGRSSQTGASPAARAGRRPALTLAAVGGVVVAVAAALLVVPRLLSPGNGQPGNGQPGNGQAGNRPAGSSTPAAASGFDVKTTTEHCPAASATGAGAACVTKPECWDGVNSDSGVITARSLSCAHAHTWQTYAIAIMPSGSATDNADVLLTNPTVRALCSIKVLLASRTGAALRVPKSAWHIQVMPPDEVQFRAGARTVRCLAGHDYGNLKSPQFAP